jgi:hypothetical protein
VARSKSEGNQGPGLPRERRESNQGRPKKEMTIRLTNRQVRERKAKARRGGLRTAVHSPGSLHCPDDWHRSRETC